MTNAGDYIGLLIQVPLVGIFIWFTLRIVDRFLKSLDDRDRQWQTFLAEQRIENINAMTIQRKEFFDAMASLGSRLGEEIKTVTQELIAHDARVREYTRYGKMQSKEKAK